MILTQNKNLGTILIDERMAYIAIIECTRTWTYLPVLTAC